jgi:penicillin-binding protein 1A
LQPNTLISDGAITLRPIGLRRAREHDYRSPKNYDGRGGGTLIMRQALENSRNRATAHLLEGGIESKPEASLNRICDLAVEAQIYRECLRFYPIVLGAQPVRPIDLAAFYAAIANEGLRPRPISSNRSSGMAKVSSNASPSWLRSVRSIERTRVTAFRLCGISARIIGDQQAITNF